MFFVIGRHNSPLMVHADDVGVHVAERLLTFSVSLSELCSMLVTVKVVTDNHSWQLVSRGCVYYACARSLRVLQAPTSR